MDKGVTAFHDGIINRNIYSNRNQYVITVSPKGIANGLSTIPKDGADFGPDTTLNATSPSQIGAPYTQTTGIREAWNYAFASATTNFSIDISLESYWMKPILLLEGVFVINQQVVLDPQVRVQNPKMIGSGTMSTYVYWNFNDHAIIMNPSNVNIIYSNIEIGYMQPQPGSHVNGNGFFAMLYTSSDPAYQRNTFQSYDMALASGSAYVFYLLEIQQAVFYNLEAYISGNAGAFHIENCSGSVYAIGCPHISSFYVNGAGELYVIGSNAGYGVTIGNVNYTYMDSYGVGGITLLSDVPYIHIDTVNVNDTYPFIASLGSTQYTVDHMKIDELIEASTQGYYTPFTKSPATGYTTANVNLLEVGKYTIYPGANGGISGVWTFTPTTPAVPVSGTAQQNTNPYPVNVYIYGGTVTQIQITKGTGRIAYTVFSNTAGIALSGQTFKLDPGDEIAIVYCTAPLWVWVC